jgi:bifunctional non-homologous end joining protein LigD
LTGRSWKKVSQIRFRTIPIDLLRLNEHLAHPGNVVFHHACRLGFEGIVSKRLGSRYRSGRSADWIKMKNPAAPAVKREAEEDWGKNKWR